MRSHIRKIAFLLLICGLISDPNVIEYLAFGSRLSDRYESYVFIFQVSITILAILLLLSSNRKIPTTIRGALINITLLYGSLLMPLYGFIGIETLGIIVKYTLLKSTPEDRVANDILRSATFRSSRILDDKTFQSEYVKSNKDGFRSPPLAPKEEQDNNFIFLGGSTAWGYNVADRNTIPAYLETRIKRVGIDIDAYNLARNGSPIDQQLRYLSQYVEILKPNFVILYNGINESPWNRPTLDENYSEYSNIDFQKPLAYFQRLARDLHANYFTFQLIFSLGGMLTGKDDVTNELSNSITKHVESYLRYHNFYEKLCIDKEISCYTFLQPTLVNKKNKTFLETVFHYSHQYIHGDRRYDYFVSKVVNKLQQQSSVRTIDLRGALSSTEISVFVDYCHLNYQGNKIISGAIFSQISDEF